MIPYGRQSINEADIQAVVDVLKSDWLTQGPAVERFETAVADYCKVSYAVAVNSATSALHIACLAAGLGPGDILWTSPNTFVASANCALYCGASVDFVDIDPRTYNMSVERLEEKLMLAARSGKLPKVVIPVHFAGQSCEMEAIASLAQRYGFRVIEDASHAIGGRYKGEPVGNCRYSDMTVFSFHPVKIITTGEGGMVLANNPKLHDRLVRLRSHGITRDPSLMTEASHGPWYYQQIELGYNYRMTDIQAALGLSQLQKLERFVQKRGQLACNYTIAFSDYRIILPWQHPDTSSSWHLYMVRLELDKIQKNQRQVFEELQQTGIQVNLHYIPVHLQPYHAKAGFSPGDFPEAEQYYREAMTIPLYPGLSDEQQAHVITTLQKLIT